MRLVVVSMLLAALGCQSAAQKQVLLDISRELDRRDNGQAVAAYERFRAHNGDDEAALRALAVGSLRQALASPDAAARRAAVQAAERHDADELFDDVTALLGDEDDVVRAAAAAAVLRSHPDAARVLAATLSSNAPEARAVAVAALGRKIPDLAEDEIRAALVDPDDGVRAAAVTALAKTDAADADALLVGAARDDRAGAVRAAAVTAVGRRVPAVARAALADPYLGARLAAVDALGKDGARALLGGDPYVALRAAALVGDPVAGGPALRAALAAPDRALREAALNQAAAIDPRAAELVSPFADDVDPRVRLAAARALGRLGRTERAREVFAATLAAEDEDLRRNAAADLLALGDPRGEAALASLAASESPATRRAAVSAFLPRRPVAAPVLAALADVDFGVRVAAADVILRAL